MRGDGDLDQVAGKGGCDKKRLDSGGILKIEPAWFADSLEEA